MSQAASVGVAALVSVAADIATPGILSAEAWQGGCVQKHSSCDCVNAGAGPQQRGMFPNGTTAALAMVSSSCVAVHYSKAAVQAPGQVAVQHSDGHLIQVVSVVAQVVEESPPLMLAAALFQLNLGVGEVTVVAV